MQWRNIHVKAIKENYDSKEKENEKKTDGATAMHTSK